MRVQSRTGSIRTALRRVVPFGVRRRLLNLIRGNKGAELPTDRFAFPSSSSYDVICFPVIDWNYLFQRPQQIVTQFARAGHRCFYIHTTFHQSGSGSFVRSIADNIFGVRLPGLRDLNALYQTEMEGSVLDLAAEALRHLREKASIDTAVCLVQLPFWAPLALAARERWRWRIVYDCLDEHSGFIGNNSAMLRHEAMLFEQGDLVTATSHRLFEKADRSSRRALFLPNAADFNHFSQPGNRPSPLAGLSRPIIGYYGAVSRWFDLEMVREAAIARPRWQFAIVGDYFDVGLEPVKGLSNVHLFSRQPYSALPSYLHAFDVAVIPFLDTPLTQATNPVKFYEYLSAGKPVVATDLPELAPYHSLFYPARSREDFVTLIEAALEEQSPERTYARVEFARQNTWSDRFRTLSKAITDLDSS